ncbi:MAG: UPF0280 family protein [Smithella sp.]|nr:UPF0280 family protein [Smithella sp.]
MEYENRTYRSLINKDNLVSYNVKIAESDLLISSDVHLADEAFESLAKHRNFLESYIKNHPEFQKSLTPLADDDLAPPIVREMLSKSKICGVGPMAGVAGAVSEFVGRDLMDLTENIIIENGGDIFLRSKKKLITSVFAGESPLSYNINFIVKPKETPVGICTSSGTVGPSLSFGKADAVCVISPSATLADAAASAIGNQVKSSQDIRKALDFGITISGITGIIIICGKDMGAIGEVELV